MTQQGELKIGDYAQTINQGKIVVGIVYETSHWSSRIQMADGEKLRNLNTSQIAPATEQQIADFNAAAIPGLTPQGVIDREEAEMAAKQYPEPQTDNADDDTKEEGD